MTGRCERSSPCGQKYLICKFTLSILNVILNHLNNPRRHSASQNVFQIGHVVLLLFAKRHMHRVAESLAYLFADDLPHTDDEARRSHLDNLAVVRHAVESGMDCQTSFAEKCLDVERHLDISGIHVLVLDNDGIEFVWRCCAHVISCGFSDASSAVSPPARRDLR